MSKLAVFFPGIGYNVDRPLMYYSRKIASKLGYEIRLLPYGGFPEDAKSGKDKMAGNTVSHSNRRAPKKCVPNLQKETITFEDGAKVTLKVCTKCKKTLKKVG